MIIGGRRAHDEDQASMIECPGDSALRTRRASGQDTPNFSVTARLAAAMPCCAAAWAPDNVLHSACLAIPSDLPAGRCCLVRIPT